MTNAVVFVSLSDSIISRNLLSCDCKLHSEKHPEYRRSFSKCCISEK